MPTVQHGFIRQKARRTNTNTLVFKEVMSSSLSLKSIFLEKINRIINPNFETKFISTLLFSGIAFLGYQRIINLASSIEFLSHDYYVKLSLSAGTDTFTIILGCLMVMSSIILFCLRLRNSSNKKCTYKSLKKASSAIRPLMDNNRRVFTTFGPKSNSFDVEGLPQDYDVWENLKTEQIIPNNAEILEILNGVKEFTEVENPIIEKMKSHIEAFKEHCKRPSFDYSSHQFPLEFADLIFQYGKENKTNVPAYKSWLRSEFNVLHIKIEDVLIYGSALYGEEKTDVDVIVKNGETEIQKLREYSNYYSVLRTKFKGEFNLELHLKAFSELERQSYESFLEKLHTTERII